MRAMVLTAGLGTRLRPLTDSTPKPLVQVGGRPMLAYVLDILAVHGYREILVNAHYLADKFEGYVRERNRLHRKQKIFIQDERTKILGSGGAITKASAWLFEHDSTALVCNADSLMRPNLTELKEKHRELHHNHKVGVTLSVTNFPKSKEKYTGLRCESDLVCEFIAAQEWPAPGLFHFPGYYMIEQEAAARLPQIEENFSIVEKLWRQLAKEKKLGAWNYMGPYHDLGTVNDLSQAEAELQFNPWPTEWRSE